jgi:hypothetical protein
MKILQISMSRELSDLTIELVHLILASIGYYALSRVRAGPVACTGIMG